MTRGGDIARAVVSLAVSAAVVLAAAACQPGQPTTPACHSYRVISAHAKCEWGHDPGQRNHWTVVYG